MNNNPWGNFDNSQKKQPPKKENENKDYNLDEKIENIFNSGIATLKHVFGFNGPVSSRPIVLFSALFLIFYLLTGVFTVAPEQQAIVTTFGKYSRTLGPGLHYRLPYPFETKYKETVTRIRTIKIGEEASMDNRESNGLTQAVYVASSDGKNTRLQEGLILTGDENIIDMHFEVQWKIKNLQAYLFNLKDPIKSITNASQSVIREVVAKNGLADILTKGRAIIESSATESLQKIMDEYNSGVEIVVVQMLRADPPILVIDAFRDVQTATVDKASDINRAETYKSDIIPKARGAAQNLIQNSEAYAVETVSRAEGQANRFNSVYSEYKNAKPVTKMRIYLETLEEVFGDVDKIIIDDSIKGAVPYLPLDFVKKEKLETRPNE